MVHIRPREGNPRNFGADGLQSESAKPLTLVGVLLRGANSSSAAEREMIATYVSSQNDCYFCQHAYGAVAAYWLNENERQRTDHISLCASVSPGFLFEARPSW
jgi:hypothetical protein